MSYHVTSIIQHTMSVNSFSIVFNEKQKQIGLHCTVFGKPNVIINEIYQKLNESRL